MKKLRVSHSGKDHAYGEKCELCERVVKEARKCTCCREDGYTENGFACECDCHTQEPEQIKGWEADYYNFLVRNGMTKHQAQQAVDYVTFKLAQARQSLIEEIRAKLVHPDSPNYNDYWKYLDSFLDDLRDGRK